MKPFILGAVFARGGSKGIPRKNIKPLCGKPLLAYAVESARAVTLLDQVIVSTDDNEISEVARRYGAQVPFVRPAELASDTAPEILSWRHAVDFMERDNQKPVDVLVSVPVTAPLRLPEDIRACVEKLLSGSADVVVTVTPAQRNPYFNMVTLDGQAQARLVIPGDKTVGTRQSAPAVYDMTTVAYAVRVPFLRQANSLWDGRVEAVVVPAQRALDIDTILDFEIAEFLMTRRMEQR